MIAIVFIVGAALAVTGWLFMEKMQSAPGGSATGTKHPLVEEKGVGVMYKLDKKLQGTLIQAVQEFCVTKYHRESCIHHLSTCGNPCMVAIPKNLRVKIFNDYQNLRKEKGLPMLLKMPPKEEP